MRTTTRLCAGLLVFAGFMSPPLAAGGDIAAAARAILSNAHIGQVQTAAVRPADAELRAASDRLIVSSRLALAVGDVRKAAELLSQADAMQVPYGPNGDSPARVRDLIARWEESNAEIAKMGKTESTRLHRSALMVEQADWLRMWDKLDEAERIAMDATTLNAQFGAGQRTPKAVLEDVFARRRETATGPYKIWDPTAPRQGNRDPNVVPVSGVMPAATTNEAKAAASAMLVEARKSLANGDVATAEALAKQAATLPAQYGPGEDHPNAVMFDVNRVRAQQGGVGNAVRPVSGEYVIPGAPGAPSPADFNQMSEAMQFFTQGEDALKRGQTAQALELYRMANARREGLDPVTQRVVRERLTLVAANPQGQGSYAGTNPENMLTEADAARQVLINQITAEVTRKQIEAGKMKANDPVNALKMLEETRGRVEQTQVEQRVKDSLIRRLDFEIADLKKHLEFTEPQRKLEAQNQATLDLIDRQAEHKVVVQNELAQLCEEFNQCIESQRFNDAELIARRAELIAPQEPVVQSMVFTAKFAKRAMMAENIRRAKENGVAEAFMEVDSASTPHSGSPYQFGDVKQWNEMTARRGAMDRKNERLTERELEIQQKLKTPVSLQFSNKPLGETVSHLAQLAAINIHLDPQGLSDEGVTTSTPISINIKEPISLKSALNLILEPLKLTYVIKDEVLKVTSKQLGDGDVYPVAYNVADLVIPIPNFVASGNMGLASAVQGALADAGGALGAARGLPPEFAVATANGGTKNAAMASNASVLSQPANGKMGGVPGQPGGGSTGAAGLGTGPAGLGSGVAPDFDSLIDLVTSTIKPESWQEVGGPGSIQGREQNLTLIVSQTQAVHEQIADLLQQLRRLQDLQVTIEVRYITLSDQFFERIGVDFDFEIDDDSDRPFQTFGQEAPGFTPTFNSTGVVTNPPRDFQDRDHGKRNVTVGMQAPGVFNADLDIPVSQGSFPLAVPQFGGYSPGAGTQLGFAILSDIESYFFIEASQGDRRSNVLQAPKVTLFNGQIAFVADVSQSPFVISVIPVVGDFAAAFQPVIVVLSEGTFLTVQAVVSPDRRFVRLTLVPFFSSIGDVDTFTFTGSATTTTTTKKGEGDDDEASTETDTSTSRSGTSVQLPTFAFVTVTTTVSVPDGGTVLLGGIKRLSEGRNEFGTPILNKIPYINRLFSNVGIGRDTSSLMMMVTPRIIIQEEEEALLLGGQGPG